MFRKLQFFPFSGVGSEKPVLLGPLERAKLNRWTWMAVQLVASRERLSSMELFRITGLLDQWLRLALSMDPAVSLPSPEDEHISSLRNIVSSGHFQFRMLEKV
jgi:hypothetical protein